VAFAAKIVYSAFHAAPLVVISNSCPILQQLMSSAVALKPVLPIFQALASRIIHISLRF
jgi:hypothetical protein